MPMTIDQFVARGPDGKRLGTLVVPSLTTTKRQPRRPLIFAFNGGPGAASGWLQLGLLGPLRVVVPDIAAYDNFYKKLISKINLTDVSSSFAMGQIKYTTALPLEFALVSDDDR